jgi:hypothetical protein
MTHLDGSENRPMTIMLTARVQEYERLADCYAGLITRCGHLRSVLAERVATCQAAQERLTGGPPSR